MPMSAHPRDAEFIFLDLDGTLSDPSEGITGGVIHALKRFGIHEEDRKKLFPFIGPPLYASFMEHYGFSKDDAYKAVTFFQEYYSTQGWQENIPYTGIKELLQLWSSEGRKLVLATSKPEVFAIRILERFGMTKDFLLIAGGDIEETRVHKDEVIGYAKQQLGLTDDIPAIMIGDTKYDVLGAAKHGIPTIGVTYGFGSRSMLEDSGAAWIVESVPALAELMRR
jgi:phosphoglycolate phosphatase